MLLVVATALVILFWDSVPVSGWWRRTESVDEARFFGSIAAELRAGASLRMALAAASAGSSDDRLRRAHRLALAGAPLGGISETLSALPRNGRRARLALRVAAVTGGRSAAVFERLAERAVDDAALAREQRTLTAQARMSAAVVGALPVLSLLVGGGSRIGRVVATGSGGLLLVVAALAMQVAGGVAVWWMART